VSDQVPRKIFALSIVAGFSWAVQILSQQIWDLVELFGGLERLAVGLLLVIAIDYSGEIFVTILAFALFWIFFRGNRSFQQLERGIQTALLASLVFLIVTPFTSGMFYFIVPQPDSGSVATILSVGRNVSVALLIGGIMFPRMIATISSLR